MFIDASQELTLKNPIYLKAVQHYVWGAYQADVAHGDLTTRLFLGGQKLPITAQVIAKEAGILAGIPEAHWFLKQLGLRVLKSMKDGDVLKKKSVILEFKGSAEQILSGERTLLNLLQRMSGIATFTSRFSKALPSSLQLLATRKTFWGDLDKRAVSVGGGSTHRLNLGDAVLVKDNHLFLHRSFESILRTFFKSHPQARFFEIELQDPKQVDSFLKIYSSFKPLKNLAVMLDNFTPAQVKACAPKLAKAGLFVEVSGGLNASNFKRYALPGVSAMSMGALTNKAPALDISLDLQA